MKKGFLVLIITTILVKLYAQEFYIDLSKHEFNHLANDLIIDSIIDVRKDKNCIGYVYKGIQNKPTPAYLEKPLKLYLDKFLINNLEAKVNAEHLIIRINRLYIYEYIFYNMEIAFSEMNLSFIVKKGNNFFEKFQAGVFIESRGSIDATNKHGKNIINALDSCFKQYS
jgi:hypothetical protein